MEDQTTQMLMDVLKSANRRDLKVYERTYLAKEITNFAGYMDLMIEKRKLKRQDIFQKADVPQKYGYKLLSGESHTSDRDKLLRIFIAMGMSLKETQRALELYGMPMLYPKIKRDAVMIIAFNQEVSSVDTVNDWLRDAGEQELSRSMD